MRRLWWIGMCGALLLLSGCEQDEGGDADAGDVGDTGDAGDTGGDTLPAPACDDPTAFANSCAADFFACFDAAGTCTIEARPNVGNSSVEAIVFESGAEWEVHYDVVESVRDDIVKNSGGAICTAAMSTQGPDDERTMSFVDGTDTLTIEIDGSGNMRLTCPGGGIESYTATQRADFLDCLGASCNGVVPFVD